MAQSLGARQWGDPNAQPKRRNYEGCPTCLAGRGDDETGRKAWGGLSRKRATAEFIKVDNTYRRFVEQRDALGAEDYWLKPKSEGGMGGKTIEDRVKPLVARGEVDFEDYRKERQSAPDSGEAPDV